MERKEVYVIDSWLDVEIEYSLDDLKAVAESRIESFGDLGTTISHYKVKAYFENEYGDHYTKFILVFYRMETDKELETRFAIEESKKEKEKIAADKRKKNKEAKELADAELLEDPDYIKFLELKEKFK